MSYYLINVSLMLLINLLVIICQSFYSTQLLPPSSGDHTRASKKLKELFGVGKSKIDKKVFIL